MEEVINLVTTEVQNHIRLADLLKDRNEELSRENICLKDQLKDEETAKRRAWDNNEELLKEIVSLRTQLHRKENELHKKDNECSIALEEAKLFNQLSKEVSKESKYYQEEYQKVNKESEHYRKVCKELQTQLTRIEPKADSVISSSVISDFCEAVNSYSEQLGALQDKLDEERQLRLREQIGEIPNDKAYIAYVENEEHKQIFADNKVLLIQDSTDLSSIAANSAKEMFLLLDGHGLNSSISKEELNMEYEKVFSICRKWKELRPDGEIHVIEWNAWAWWLYPQLGEMIAMSTSYHKFQRSSGRNENKKEKLTYVVSIFWPKYYKQLLSDVPLEEYLSMRDITDKLIWDLS